MIFLLNIPLCIALYIALVFWVMRNRIVPDNLNNPSIIGLTLCAIALQSYAMYRVLKYYDILRRRSLVICLLGVCASWVALFVMLKYA